MSITINAKGTSNSSFRIGKSGTTLYQGANEPTGINGDFWFNTSTGELRSKQSGIWELTNFSSIETQSAKNSVRVASTSNVTILSPGNTIDGITLNTNDRILLKNQTDQTENGIYKFISNILPLERTEDANSWTKLIAAEVSVEEGASNSGTQWFSTTTQGGVLGTNPVVWRLLTNQQTSSLANLSINGLIAKTGTNTVTSRSISGSSGRIAITNGDGVSGNPTIDLSTSGVTPGIYTKLTVDEYGRITLGTTLAAGDLPAHGHTISEVTGLQIALDTKVTFTASTTAPVSPAQGDEWLDTNTGIIYKWFNDADSGQWVDFGKGGQGGFAKTSLSTSGKVLVNGEIVVADSSSGALTYTLPVINVSDTREIVVIRRGANTVSINRNTGQTIEGLADDLQLDADFQRIVIAPVSATNWIVLNRTA